MQVSLERLPNRDCYLRFGLAGRKELVLASLNGKVQGARVHFSRHNSPNSRALPTGVGEVSGSDP